MITTYLYPDSNSLSCRIRTGACRVADCEDCFAQAFRKAWRIQGDAPQGSEATDLSDPVAKSVPAFGMEISVPCSEFGMGSENPNVNIRRANNNVPNLTALLDCLW